MTILFSLLYLLLLLFLLSLIIRLIFDWVQVFARQWRPRGAALVLASAVYGVTDPPLKRLRRMVPPLRLGNMSIDLAFIILLIATGIAMSVVRGFA